MREGKFKRVLLVATGALMSTTTAQQGDTIPGIAHAIELEYVGENKPNNLKLENKKKQDKKLSLKGGEK